MEGDTSPSVWEQLSALDCPKAGRWSPGGSSSFRVLRRKLLLPRGVSGRLNSSPASRSLRDPPAPSRLGESGQGGGARP